MIESETWARVNGELIRNHIRKSVSLIGKVESVDPSGMKVKIMSSDNKTINVTLSEPVNETLLDKWIEVVGTAMSADTIKCEQVITFAGEDENEEAFDTTAHTLLVHFLNNDAESVFKIE